MPLKIKTNRDDTKKERNWDERWNMATAGYTRAIAHNNNNNNHHTSCICVAKTIGVKITISNG